VLTVKQVARDTIKLRVYDALRRAILEARFRPGEVITLRLGGEALGTSMMPVREALHRLVAERALEAQPNRSPRVPVLDETSLREILELRCMLEGRAAAQAARIATPADREEIAAAQTEFAAASRSADPNRYLCANTAFHFAVYQAARMPRLLPMIESLWLQYAPTFRVTLDAMGPQVFAPDGGLDHHGELVRALEEKDPDAAQAAIVRDILEPTQRPGFWEALTAPPRRGARRTG